MAPNKGRSFPAEVLTPDEVTALIKACSNRAPTGIRNRALITALYRGGLRLGEALALAPKDVDLNRGTITVLHGKGDRRRTVGIDPGAVAILGRWVDKRRTLQPKRGAPLFCTLDGKPLHPSYVRTLLPRLAAKTGIDKRVHPHGLRHTHAYELMWEGTPMPIIQRQLGHANLATTQRYLDHIAPKDVVEMMQQREWAVPVQALSDPVGMRSTSVVG
ncbi:MAG: tyrosine-type recombinase/integrase [Acidobacteria bacterium]|nr:tyrosine-type recombinase/integrase [Acidobacteriota bacterium]